MRGNEFLDKMELIDPAYIEAADAKPKKRKNVWVKWGAMAACFCLVLAGAMAIGDVRQPAARPVPYPNGPTRWESVPEVWPEHPILRPGDEGYIAPEPTPDLAPEDPVSNNGAAIFLPNNVTEFPDVKPMISDYGEMTYPGDMAVENGGVCYSQTLISAMEHYGDTANYRVYVELFSDGVQISSGGELALREIQRLSDLGYIVALEKIIKPEGNGEYTSVSVSYHFTLHASYEQMKNFMAGDNLGCSLMLYGEYFGPSTTGDSVVFNVFEQDGN